MPKSRSSFPAPGRVFLPGCALAAGLLLIAPATDAAPAKPATTAKTAPAKPAPAVAAPAMTLRVGKTATYPLPARSTFVVEAGALNIVTELREGTLYLRAVRAGEVRLRIRTPDQGARLVALQLVEPDDEAKPAPTGRGFGSQTLAPAPTSVSTTGAMEIPPIAPAVPRVTRLASSQVVQRAPQAGGAPQNSPLAGGGGIPPISLGPNLGPMATPAQPAAGTFGAGTPAIGTLGIGTPGVGTPGAGTAGIGAGAAANPFQLLPPDFGGGLAQQPVTASPTSEFGANPLPPQNFPPQNFPPAGTTPRVQLTPQTQTQIQQAAQALGQNSGAAQTTPGLQGQLPRLPGAPQANNSANPATGTRAPDTIINPTLPPEFQTGGTGASISPSLPAPASNFSPNVSYKTTPKLPASFNQLPAKQAVNVTQGEARLLTFQNNILSVFFSDPNVMDARAINARTIAVTGTGAGQSTLAVFTERYPGDAVGFASVYRVSTQTRASGLPIVTPDPSTVEAALTTALGDPRIRVSVVKLPEGTLAARLTGIVRDAAEVQGAITTASFFVPRVLPSVYADPNVPSIDAVLSGAVEKAPAEQLQDNLRRITGNPSIELIAMPGSLVLKADADSQEEAQNLLQLLPTLNQAVIPFVTVRGGGRVESSNVPLLQGEDLQLTQKLQAVTGVRTVYAVRASGNSIAIYGTVQDRAEYQAVKRYGLVVAQSSVPVPQQGAAQGGSVFRPTGIEPALAAYDPAAGYARQLGVQMFVRIIDPTESTIRNVTIETNIVEITRTNLKNLGAEYGSATLTGESIGAAAPLLDQAGNPVIDGNGRQVLTPGVTTRTLDPTFQAGQQILGNGFAGFGGFGTINPFRTRINAIAQRNNARVLASPNIRATEGTVAQITIGGERPVPSASASFGANAQSIEFRRFGVILTMRPTVSDDNTIILQIRADVTQPDQTFAINVGGAIIPGESVRSIDTTITVRPGDIVVMGGLLTNDKRQQTSKVPILGDIPIIGSLFRSKRFENNETELAIFMTPRIDALPATQNTTAILERIPSFPALPGRQESNAVLQTNNVRQSG